MVVEAAACFRGGADAIVSSNTFPSLPMIDPETLEFEINVDGMVSSGGLGRSGDPSDVAREHGEDDAGISRPGVFGDRRRVRLRAGAFIFPARAAARCRCARRRCSIRRSGRNVIKRLNAGLDAFLERKHADKGWKTHRGFPRDHAETEWCCNRRSVGPKATRTRVDTSRWKAMPRRDAGPTDAQRDTHCGPRAVSLRDAVAESPAACRRRTTCRGRTRAHRRARSDRDAQAVHQSRRSSRCTRIRCSSSRDTCSTSTTRRATAISTSSPAS